MDILTIKKNLDRNSYAKINEFEDDVFLMFHNAMIYNLPGTVVHRDAKFLKDFFEREWFDVSEQRELSRKKNRLTSSTLPMIAIQEPQQLERDVTGQYVTTMLQDSTAILSTPILTKKIKHTPIDEETAKKCKTLIKILYSSQSIFNAPVDPMALNIPTYFNIIKEPMDIGTIRNKVDKLAYKNINDLKSDIEQVLKNCFTFNAPSTFSFFIVFIL